MNALRRHPSVFLPGLALLCAFAPAAAAQGRKLNSALARPVGGDIQSYELTPDGERVVYVADEETDQVFELYSAKPNAVGSRVKLAGPGPAGGQVSANPKIGPLGRNVVFRGNLELAARFDLYSVPVDGGARVTLVSPFLGDALSVAFDPSETRIVYSARADVGGQAFFSVPVTGGVPVQLSAGGTSSLSLGGISPDGTRVVYSAGTGAGRALHGVPITGGVPVQLTPFGSTDVRFVAISPDGAQVFFHVGSVQARELYRVPIGGGAPIRVSPAGVRFELGLFRFAGGSPHIVFGGRPAGTLELFAYSAPLDGGRPAATLVDEPLVDHRRVVPSPDGLRLAFEVDTGSGFELLLVPADGSAGAVTLASAPPASGPPASFDFTPDGRYLIYQARAPKLFRVAADGSGSALELATLETRGLQISPDSTRVVLSVPEVAAPNGVALFALRVDGSGVPVRIGDGGSLTTITPDSTRVIQTERTDLGFAFELVSLAIDGAGRTVLNDPLPRGGTVCLVGNRLEPFRISPIAGGRVVFLASQAADEQYELFSAPQAGTEHAFRINAEFPAGPVLGDVNQMGPSPDGVHAVYLADQEQDGLLELYSVRTDRRGAPVKLSPELGLDKSVDSPRPIVFTPDGENCLYWVDELFDGPASLLISPLAGGAARELVSQPGFPTHFLVDPSGTRVVYGGPVGAGRGFLSVPLDGSAPPVALFGPPEDANPVLVTPDGRVVYRRLTGLFVVPLDGSAGSLQLDAPASPLTFFEQVQLDALGGRVVYLADHAERHRYELCSAPLDGSAAPLRLTPGLPSDRDVEAPVVAADGTVFFLADLEANDRFELYRIPSDGSAQAVKLSAPLVAGGRVTDFQLSADGTRLVYRADQAVDERFELFGLPSDGSAPPRRLSGVLGNGDVSVAPGSPAASFALTPDGTRVVFAASRGATGLRRLHVAPSDGSTPPRLLSDAPATAGEVTDFRLAPLGTRVVYRAQLGADAFALFDVSLEVPLDASGARRVSGIAAIAAGDYEIAHDDSQVLFLSDQITPDVIELFASTLTRPFRGESR